MPDICLDERGLVGINAYLSTGNIVQQNIKRGLMLKVVNFDIKKNNGKGLYIFHHVIIL
jgi:hypothetical protein